MKRLISILTIVLTLGACSSENKSTTDGNENMVAEVEYVEEEHYIKVETMDTREVAQKRYQELLEKKSNDRNVAVMYADGSCIWFVYRKDDGYKNSLWVYNSIKDNVQDINMNKTDFPDDEVFFHAFSENNGKITVIMEEMRNSDGWVEGTSVWTIDTSNKQWKSVAHGVSGAEFVNNGTAIKITEAKDLTPDEPTFAKQYSYTYRTISL